MTNTKPEQTRLLIRNIRVTPDAGEAEILEKARQKMKRAGFALPTLHFRLYKKSVDARHRDAVALECVVLAEGTLPPTLLTPEKLNRADAAILEEEPLCIEQGTNPMKAPPFIVGMGPAGLFAALLLARNGYAPILTDRGGSVEERAADVEKFRKTGILNPESNVQFGAGGAGTFSDGKLMTRIRDPRCAFVLQTLTEFGAPEEILVRAKPHIGTDLLRGVISRMLAEIERLGGRLLYHCRTDGIRHTADGTILVKTSKGDFSAGAVILAPGHSARDTYLSLMEQELVMEPKPISVGVRVEHLQRDIDRALYGNFAGHPNLGHAEYALSDTGGKRGVYTFCMCPGGEVVAASSEEGMLAVNGMSYHARSLPNANAAVAVSVGVEDLEPVNGSRVVGAIAFQRSIERAAYLAGGGSYFAPIMTMGDFLNGKRGSLPTTVQPSYLDGMVRPADFETVFPPFVTEALRRGLRAFGKKLHGYDAPEAILTAAETRTSAPLRILRDPETLCAIGQDGIYPAGEGAGYAGGITSAAVDGIRVSMALMRRFAPEKKNS